VGSYLSNLDCLAFGYGVLSPYRYSVNYAAITDAEHYAPSDVLQALIALLSHEPSKMLVAVATIKFRTQKVAGPRGFEPRFSGSGGLRTRKSVDVCMFGALVRAGLRAP